jgi:3-oxoacyl-[acyl-carrier protein] reductase
MVLSPLSLVDDNRSTAGSFHAKVVHGSRRGTIVAMLDLRLHSKGTAAMPGLLQNHIAAVTGSGSGIGRAIALGYAREGAKLAVLDINGEAAAKTAADIRDSGGKAQHFTLDVTDRMACRAIAAKVASDVGAVSILVNNAGINRRNAFTSDPDAVIKDWQDIMAINLNGVFNVTHAFLAPLRANKGRIVNIASIQSFMHVRTPNSPAYTTSKHGVLGFTRALAAELGKDGVRVNAIGPGFIETPLNEKVRATNPELVKIFLDHTPLGRTGKPDDIVGPAIFLASDLAAYVTGSIVMADGGYRTI